MSVDPENSRAQQRSATGLSRETTFQQTDNAPLPSKGGTRGYATWKHERALEALLWTASYWEAADRVG